MNIPNHSEEGKPVAVDEKSGDEVAQQPSKRKGVIMRAQGVFQNFKDNRAFKALENKANEIGQKYALNMKAWNEFVEECAKDGKTKVALSLPCKLLQGIRLQKMI